MSQTEDYSPKDRKTDDSEELLQRNMVFSPVLYFVRTKNTKQVRNPFWPGLKKSAPTQSVWPQPLGSEFYHGRSTSIGVPGRETFNFYF